MKEDQKKMHILPRGPVVAVMGHIDHGKSTLLSFIRKNSEPLEEAGGITQHISAYEVVYGEEDDSKIITFLDTPGHEAFSGIRKRGANVADIAVLVVSAEDGVKPQTIEALESILKSNTPFVVAINKIDKPGANIEKTKQSLAENKVYVEGYGGDVPCVNISAKTGEGVQELLDIIMLICQLENLSGDTEKSAEGVVIESNKDMKKGITATCIIKDGGIKNGMYVTSGISSAPVRIMENFLGKQISSATFPSPVRIVGWDSLPEVGENFKTWNSREEALRETEKQKENPVVKKSEQNLKCEITLPLIVKADTGSSLEAIIGEISKLWSEKICPEIIYSGIGNILESDVKMAQTGKSKSIIIGFGVATNPQAKSLSERSEITIKTFDIIYKLNEWLSETLKEKTPKEMVKEVTGSAKILKTFSKTKDRQILGGKVEKGAISLGAQIRILRRETEIGEGKIRELQSQKNQVKEVSEGREFGAMIESKIEILHGDRIEIYTVIEK
jgi:translation initiation factor IF-2